MLPLSLAAELARWFGSGVAEVAAAAASRRVETYHVAALRVAANHRKVQRGLLDQLVCPAGLWRVAGRGKDSFRLRRDSLELEGS